MGLMRRLQRITRARIEGFLDAVESPEVVFPQLVKEMEGAVREAQRAEAKALTVVKATQRKLDELTGRIQRLEKGAELALAKGDEQTARDALAAQLQVEKNIELQESARARGRDALEQARVSREQLVGDMEDLKARKEEIITRARVAGTEKKVQKTISSPSGSGKGILDEVARMEEKVMEAEAEIDVRREMNGRSRRSSLDERLRSLEEEEEVEKRLAELRKRKK